MVSKIGYGFLIDAYKITLLKQSNPQLAEKFFNSYFLQQINTYTYFFGIITISINPGNACRILPYYEFDDEQVIKMLDNYKTFFPKEKNYFAKDYLLSCID